jgi:hypothetical protein
MCICFGPVVEYKLVFKYTSMDFPTLLSYHNCTMKIVERLTYYIFFAKKKKDLVTISIYKSCFSYMPKRYHNHIYADTLFL